MQDARVSLIGDVEALSGDEAQQVKEVYKKKHPGSFWVDFGDFSVFRLTPKTARLIGGFARAGQVTLYSALIMFASRPFIQPTKTLNTSHAPNI